MTLIDPTDNQWYMDSGATAHLANSAGTLKSVLNGRTGKTITVANSIKVPIESSGSLSFPTRNRPLALKSVLVTPSLIKNLISVRRFTKDNSCSVEFEPLGFTLKDLRSQKRILRSDSTWDLYPLLPSPNKATIPQPQAFFTTSSNVWHRRLSHCNNQTLNSLLSNSVLSCNKSDIHFFLLQIKRHRNLKLFLLLLLMCGIAVWLIAIIKL